jgi:hypothetical protein
MQDKFEELLGTEDQDRKAELEAFFLERTADKLGSTSKESALQVAAAFDRFKKEAEQAGESHFTQLFGVLSKTIKDKSLDRKEDIGELSLDDFE